MLTGELIQKHSPQITLKEIDPKAFSSILNYIYTLKMEINEETVEELMKAASMLQLDGALKLCVE